MCGTSQNSESWANPIEPPGGFSNCIGDENSRKGSTWSVRGKVVPLISSAA